ncbi:MAG: hypothetical protein Q8O92_10615 [Candidatus Latescibacter sp.]|nr:hypothetical protein [Candidatus Latescibacter sp.]
MIDAIISVYHINNQKSNKSYFISTVGSAVFPNIGHGYLGNKNNVRGWLYSFGETVSFFTEKDDFVMGIRLFSTVDAAVSTHQANAKNFEVIFMPGIKSGYLLLSKTF